MSNPTQVGTLLRDDNGNATSIFNYQNVTTGTVLVKTGAGFLHQIIINNPGAGVTIELDDALTHTSPVIGTINTSAAVPVTLTYDVAFSTGLSITCSGACDITVSYR